MEWFRTRLSLAHVARRCGAKASLRLCPHNCTFPAKWLLIPRVGFLEAPMLHYAWRGAMSHYLRKSAVFDSFWRKPEIYAHGIHACTSDERSCEWLANLFTFWSTWLSQVLKRAVRNEKVAKVEGEFPRGETALFAPGALLALMFRQCCLVSSWAVIAVLRGAGHTFFKEVKKAGEVYSGCEWARRGWSSNLSSRRSMGPVLVGPSLEPKGALLGHTEQQCRIAAEPSRWLMIVTVASRRTIMCVLRWCCVWWQMFYTHMLQQGLVPGAEAEAPPKEEPADSKFQLKSRLLFTPVLRPRLLLAATSIGILREHCQR